MRSACIPSALVDTAKLYADDGGVLGYLINDVCQVFSPFGSVIRCLVAPVGAQHPPPPPNGVAGEGLLDNAALLQRPGERLGSLALPPSEPSQQSAYGIAVFLVGWDICPVAAIVGHIARPFNEWPFYCPVVLG
jgi:hypothetical protein